MRSYEVWDRRKIGNALNQLKPWLILTVVSLRRSGGRRNFFYDLLALALLLA